jgi:molybdopterin converting factor small subunit
LEGVATIKLVGNLGHYVDSHGALRGELQELEIGVPISLREAVQIIESKYQLRLPRESILILVNGVEANALDDLDTMIYQDDHIVFVPMYHGGSYC